MGDLGCPEIAIINDSHTWKIKASMIPSENNGIENPDLAEDNIENNAAQQTVNEVIITPQDLVLFDRLTSEALCYIVRAGLL